MVNDRKPFAAAVMWVSLWVGIAVFGVSSNAHAVCLTPPGDISGVDDVTNIADVQCSILMNLWSLGGQSTPVPICMTAPGSPAIIADHNCDGVINVGDTLLAINFALQLALEPIIDANGNQCVDACETDSDGDGTTDLLDCAPLNSGISTAAVEVCNGFDDDCNGLVDEGLNPAVAASCSDNTVCTGIESCTALLPNLGVLITEIMVQPTKVSETLGEWFEIYNGSSASINIAGWTISNSQGQSHVITPGGSLFVPPAGYLVLGTNANFTQNGGARVAYAYVGFTLDNAAGSVVLHNKDGVEIDRVEYGVVQGIPVIAGASMALKQPDLDNNAGTSWATSTVIYGAGDKGTPWSPNIDVMPSFCAAGTPLVCNDNNGCTDDSCNATAGCVFTPNTAACDDGNVCTTTDTCASGACVGGPALNCDDGNGCTDDSCDPATGCVNLNNTIACDDGDACTAGDVCQSGVCSAGAAIDCDDGNPCTDDGCDPASGCTNVDNTAGCDDDNACTAGDVCADGGCVAGAAQDCDDGNGCTDDSCDPATGCVNINNTIACDDGDACTALDVCGGGSCIPGDAINCNDGDECTADSCVPESGCVFIPAPGCELEGSTICLASGPAGTKIQCPLKLSRITQATPPATSVQFRLVWDAGAIKPVSLFDTVCTGPGGTPPCSSVTTPPGILDPTGHTVFPIPEDMALASGGSTVFILPLSAPNTPITTAYQFVGAPVGNPDFLTFEVESLVDIPSDAPLAVEVLNIVGATGTVLPMVGTMDNGIMVMSLADCGVDPGVCADGSICTTDACDPVTHQCIWTDALGCNDLDVCNGVETCDPVAGCVAGTPASCDDGVDCTTDGCDPAVGCEHGLIDGACDDGKPCTADVCDPTEGCQHPVDVSLCNDNIPCTEESCDAAGQCVHTAIDGLCDDGAACTADSCDAALGCVYTADVSACADDNNGCTETACLPVLGCTQTPVPDCLPDGALCALSGTAGQAVSCVIRVARATVGTPLPAAIQLTLNYNAAALNPTAFEDVICTGPLGTPPCGLSPVPPSTLFPSGHTVATLPPVSVWNGVGNVVVYHPAVPTSVVTDAYLQASAVVGDPDVMIFQATLAVDVPQSAPVLVEASKISGVTADVTGLVGTVQGGIIVLSVPNCTAMPGVCNDGDPCTVDACNAGTCDHTPLECSDSDACNGTETCLPLVGCQLAVAPTCDDGQQCTVDGCDPALGCVYAADVTGCDDGIGCTADSCVPFEGCVYTPETSGCNDGNFCTTDTCELGIGCTNTPDDAACDDGQDCSTAVCDVTAGCVFETDDAACAEDGDPCTLAQCVVGAGCTHVPTLDCPTENAVCLLSGEAGQLVSCTLRLAKTSQLTPDPASLQVTLSYDEAILAPNGLSDFVCPDPFGPCMEQAIPPGAVWPSGHTVTAAPFNLTTWAGLGSLFFYHPGDPGAALGSAWANGPGFVGETQLIEVAFLLLESVAANAPVAVEATQIVASTADVVPMSGTVVSGVMVVGLVDCTANPGVCDDGDLCTTDSCDPGTHACMWTPVTCTDGDACNGLESCVFWKGCVQGTPPQCDDGIGCTSDVCDPALGCVFSPVDLSCDDGLACTVDVCDPDAGCTYEAVDITCDDGVLCTVDTCTVGVGCTSTPQNTLCDDGAACTTEVCDSALGCLTTTDDAACDDGNPCTVDACTLAHGCTHTLIQSMECLPPGALCAFSGAEGQVLTCPLRLARAAGVMPGAAALQLTVSYEADALSIDGLVDSLCLGPGGPCMDVTVPPAFLSPTGHQVALAPSLPGTWNGSGTLFVFHPGEPTVTITDAAVDSGALSGEPLFAELVVTLLKSVSPDSPAIVWPQQILGSTGNVAPLAGTVISGVIITSVVGCGSDTECDDGNACTVDTCEGGVCAFGGGPECDDGDPCNGTESCDPWSGTCVGGDVLDCDDGDACTTDGCDNAGCFNAPILTDECLPPGALCGVTGTAGTTVICQLRVVRQSVLVPAPAAFEATLITDGNDLVVTGFFDTVCFGDGGTEPCVLTETPPNVLFPTGHSVVLIPQDLAEWTDGGTVFLFHPTSPVTELTDVIAGVGDLAESVVIDIEVTLQQTVGMTEPAYLWITEPIGVTADVQELKGQVLQGIVELSTLP